MMYQLIKFYDIPLVKMITNQGLSDDFVEKAKAEEGVEGYVVNFENGNKIKIKNEWYCQIHRAKSYLSKERHVVELIINQKLDDLKSLLLADDLKRLEQFEKDFHVAMDFVVNEVINVIKYNINNNISRKDYAIDGDKNLSLEQFVFNGWGSVDYSEIWKIVSKYVLSKCSRDVIYKTYIEDGLLKNMNRWTPVRISDE